MAQDQTKPDVPRDEQAGANAAGCLARIFWMMLGNLVLVIAALAIFQGPSLALTRADMAYWLIVLALAAVRYADIRYLDGKKADGEPATLADWRRYSNILFGSALITWLLLHALAALGI